MSIQSHHDRIVLAGVDLAWQSERHPSAIAVGVLSEGIFEVNAIEPAIFGIDNVFNKLTGIVDLRGIAVDAPLIINNARGQRSCETGIGREYGSRHAACHTSNTKLYPDARSVYLSHKLQDSGFDHLQGEHWQIECYPHPAIIEIFALPERLKYKKGRVAERKAGQKVLAQLILSLRNSKLLKLAFSDDVMLFLDESYIDSLVGQSLKSNEDALDSIICLYIAGLYAGNFGGKVFGDVATGYIWVPQDLCV